VPEYKVYGNLQITKDDIAFRRVEAIDIESEMMAAYQRNSGLWRKHYWAFLPKFRGLFEASIYFVSRSKKAGISELDIRNIRKTLDIKGTPINPYKQTKPSTTTSPT